MDKEASWSVVIAIAAFSLYMYSTKPTDLSRPLVLDRAGIAPRAIRRSDAGGAAVNLGWGD